MKTTKALFGILTITAALAVQVQAQTFLTNGLIAYYPFNGNANDASGNGRNGTITGTTFVPDRFGNPAGAISFASVNDNVVVANSLHSQGEVTVTYSCWVRQFENMVNDAVHMSIINCGFGGTVNARSELGTVRGLPIGSAAGLAYTGEGNDASTTNAVVTTNVWHHLVITKYQTNVLFYTDGSLAGSLPRYTQPGQNVTSQQLNIGWNGTTYWHSGEHLYGVLDDVRIYNRALSASEVQQLYVYESGPQVNLIKAVKPSFSNLTLTTNYQLQVSADLNTWTNQGSAFTATNTSMIYPQYWDVDNWNKLFFRLQVTP
jgi:hypothetical protein